MRDKLAEFPKTTAGTSVTDEEVCATGHETLMTTDQCAASAVSEHETLMTAGILNERAGQEDVDEEGWTPVAPGKIARRGYQKSISSSRLQGGTVVIHEHDSTLEGQNSAASTEQNRDGNPLIPSPQ
ncbi:unnamed protein product [Amaranthus hypochondriacus]